MAFTNFGKRFFIYIQAVSQCHSCFPFFLIFFSVECNHQTLFTDIQCYVSSPPLVTLWQQQCKQRGKSSSHSSQNTCRELGTNMSTVCQGLVTGDTVVLLTFRQIRSYCGAQSWGHPGVAASSFLHKRVQVNQWLYNNNVNAQDKSGLRYYQWLLFLL